MKVSKAWALAALALIAPVTAAQADVRPGLVALPSLQAAKAGQVPAGMRVGAHVGKNKSDLLGAPLLFVFLGAVAITIGTIIITNNNGKS